MTTRRRYLSTACFGLLFSGVLVGARPTAAQDASRTLVGRAVVADTGRPLQGVLVTLHNEAGRRIGSRLTNGSGRFVFDDLDAGRYNLVGDMIGYSEATAGPVEVGTEPPGLVELRLPIAAIVIEGVDVSTERQCGMDPEEGQALARVWSEVREALERTAMAGAMPLLYQGESFERRLTRDADVVIEETVEPETIVSGVPYVSLEPEVFVEHGFVFRDEETGQIDYYGPDANVLLSNAFLDTHCLELEEGDDENEGLIGLRFEPTEGRGVPEIEGALWIEPSTMALRHMDFRFRDVLRGRRSRLIGGRTDFTQLPNGLWIIDHWYLRLPIVSRNADSAWGRARSQFYHRDVLAMQEVGGRVHQILGPSGELVLDAEAGLITGMVVSASDEEPRSGVIVRLEGTGRMARTNEDGRFQFSDLEPGGYVIAFETSDGSELGTVEDEAAAGQQTFVRFVVGG